jgi:hypothetical protein
VKVPPTSTPIIQDMWGPHQKIDPAALPPRYQPTHLLDVS